MWRWVTRIWVSIVVFWFLMFMSGLILGSLVHLSLRMEFYPLRQWIRNHDLLTMFLLGVSAGLPVLGSRFTGRGWFRSRSGLSYEGFKLEKIKRWMWLLISPVLPLGAVAWVETQRETGVFSSVTFLSFYHGFLMPNCSSGGLLRYRGDTTCSMNLLAVGVWMAAVGYSLSPTVRHYGAKLKRAWQRTDGEVSAAE